MESKITYFEKAGKQNTDATLRLARERAEALGIRQIVVASTWGDTALKAVEVFAGFKLVIVGVVIGPKEHAADDTVVSAFSPEVKQKVEDSGGTVLNATHVFGGLSRAFRDQLGWKSNPVSLMAAAIRIFGHGMKVAVEVSMMAADAGLIDIGEDVISIAGRGRGSDTAVVIKPVNAHRFFDLNVREIICKPR